MDKTKVPSSYDEPRHYPVLWREICHATQQIDASSIRFIDCTLGEGGHSQLFLDTFPHSCGIGVDIDNDMLVRAQHYLSAYESRMIYNNAWFDEFWHNDMVLHTEKPHIILFDFGLSTYHFNYSDRGFSFHDDMLLDMRLDSQMLPLYEQLDTLDHKQLAYIIREYGEERYSGRIARIILEWCQSTQPHNRYAQDLAMRIDKLVGVYYKKERIHPATRTFQALRIWLNDEIERIKRALDCAFDALAYGGMLLAISFHSLEDRCVKQNFRHLVMPCICPQSALLCQCGGKPSAMWYNKKPITPTHDECVENRASRSAKLRIIIKLTDRR